MRTQKRQTIINLAAKIISFTTTFFVSFLLTPYLVKNIGKEAYSFYPIANTFVSYMSIVTMALNSMSSRFITIAITQKKFKEANEYFSSIFIGNVIISVILVIPMILVVAFLHYILNIPDNLISSIQILFSLVFITMIVNLLSNVFGVVFFCKNRLDLNAVNEIFVGIIRIILYVILFTLFKPTIIYIGVVSFICALATAAFQFYYSKKLLPNIKISLKNFNKKAIKTILNSGVWNSVNQIGTILLSTVGLVLCNKFYGADSGADYSLALTVPHFMNGIVSLLSAVFVPVITIKYALGDKQKVVEYVKQTQRIIGAIDNIPISVFMAVGVNFFNLWIPSVNAEHLQRLSILAIGYLLITSTAWPVSNLNIVMNQVKVPALVMLLTGIVNIVLSYLAFKFTDIGIYSIPLIELVLYILNRGIFVLSFSAIKIGRPWYTFYPPVIKNLISAVIIFSISRLVNFFVNPQTWITLILECAFLGVIGLVINLLIMVKLSEVKEFFRR